MGLPILTASLPNFLSARKNFPGLTERVHKVMNELTPRMVQMEVDEADSSIYQDIHNAMSVGPAIMNMPTHDPDCLYQLMRKWVVQKGNLVLTQGDLNYALWVVQKFLYLCAVVDNGLYKEESSDDGVCYVPVETQENKNEPHSYGNAYDLGRYYRY